MKRKKRYLTTEIKSVFSQHNLDSSALNINVLDVTTLTTFNFLYLTAALGLQTGLFRWYMCNCHYLLLCKEVLDGKVLRETNI